MKHRVLAFCLFLALRASGQDAATTIRSALTAQVEAWNRGDIPAFMTAYAEDCVFIGQQLIEGKSGVLARYQHKYPTPAAMGKLTFSNLRMRPVDAQVMVVTGEWHLDRASASGGIVSGLFSLVWRLDHGNWRIALDHTS
jgi:ketosteroid isomerase-like protein